MDIDERDDPRLPLVKGYGPGHFTLAGVRVEGAALVLPEGWVRLGALALDEVSAAHLEALAQAEPPIDLLLVGTGARWAEIPPAMAAHLKALSIRAESMASAAAARTFNVLLLEDRRVACLLFPVGGLPSRENDDPSHEA